MISVRRYTRIVALMAAALLAVSVAKVANAQSVVVEGPTESTLPTLTPTFTLKALGVPLSDRPLNFTLFISRSPNADNQFIETIAFTTSDTIKAVRVTRLLPHLNTVYWKARVILGTSGRTLESPVSTAHLVPSWLTLVYPFPTGGRILERKPRFQWGSAPVDPDFGQFVYDLQVSDQFGGNKFASSGIQQNFFDSPDSLRANTLYNWQVTVRLVPGGDSLTVGARFPFLVEDPAVPTKTLLYRNFPNPFPAPSSQVTCFWFDIGAGGAMVSIDVVDLRGTLVKRIVTATRFGPGKYGPGPTGSGNNCDARFTWNGTSADGRTVPAGVYLLRFNADGKQSFTKMMFRGR